MRRPSGRTMVPAWSGSGPAYFAASPVGPLAVHWPWTGEGKPPSHGSQLDACGMVPQSPVFWQA